MAVADTRALSFMLGDELFAVEIGMVQEVVEWERLEPVPRAPDFVLGVFSYHGRVITVVNLAKFFGKEAGDIGGEKRIVILTGEDMSVGFMVDKTERIENFDRDSLLAGAELALEKGFVKAVVNHGGRLYNIVDIERLLEHIEDRFSTPVQRA